MSIYTWKDEFLPVSADSATESNLVATKHALLKWSGALPPNLEKHGVKYADHTISDEDKQLTFTAGNCALCKMYPRTKVTGPDTAVCVDAYGDQCPFYTATNEVCPYNESIDDAAVMVKAIKKVIKYLEKEGSNANS